MYKATVLENSQTGNETTVKQEGTPATGDGRESQCVSNATGSRRGKIRWCKSEARSQGLVIMRSQASSSSKRDSPPRPWVTRTWHRPSQRTGLQEGARRQDETAAGFINAPPT